MLLDKIKLHRHESFTRQHHADVAERSDGFVLIADERRFVWAHDTVKGKTWGMPFEGIVNWLRAPEQEVAAPVAAPRPILLRQARVKQDAQLEHNLDEQQLHEDKGFAMSLVGAVVYVTDKARNREVPLALTDFEYFEFHPNQVDQAQPMLDAVRPLALPSAKPKSKGKPKTVAKEAQVADAG